MINPSYVAQRRIVYACDNSLANKCEEIADFWDDIDDDWVPARTISVEKVRLKRNPDQENVEVTINNKSTVRTLPYFKTGDNFFLNYVFNNEQAIRLNLMLVYNSKNFYKSFRYY